MPSRRAAQKAPAAAASTALAASLDDMSAKIQQGVSQWTESGQADIQSALQTLLDQVDSTSLGTLLLSNALVGLVKSELSLEQLVETFSGLIDEFDDDAKGDKVLHLGEALVDVVEVLQESKEDTSDLHVQEDAMDEDDQEKPISTEDKGLEVVRSLIGSGHIPSHIANLLLSPDLLVRLSLHPYPGRPELLQRTYIKRNTTLFFKQSKYNLLRESSEGFSALVVLLTGSDAFSSRPENETDVARKRRAEQVWGKIMGLIGYFNLSPPRVLDLILEVASCQIAAQWKFLLDLLRCSPWGSAEKAQGKGKERAREKWMEDETMAIEHALDAVGDRVLCQVLGVKFGFYQRQDGGETPYGLVVMSALLVKHGLVGLSDLLAFLSPDDAQMKPIHDAYLASTNSRSGPANALSSSVLIDDEEGASSTAKAEDSGPPPKPPPEQRIMLLQALLSIGDLASAMIILARFPWLAQSHPAIADLIMRNVACALEPIYEAIRQKLVDEDGEIDEEVALPGFPVNNRQVLTPTYLFPPPPDTAVARYEFFYPDWKDAVDQWTSVEDLLTRGLRWLGLVRGTAGRQVETMVKICRIGAAHFAALRREKEVDKSFATVAKTKEEIQSVEPTSDEMKPWLDLIRISILPALSTSSGAAAFDVELWYFLRHLPYPVRYSLYGEWRDSTCRPIGRHPCPAASHAAAEATREIKKALSRVTASQSAPSGPAASTDRGPARALAKLSHSNPHALWTTAVTQVKAYPNIGQFIVEAGRYMTQMSTDVAMFTLVDTLSDDTASRLNPNGTDVAQWLASLATFVGDFNRRYASMDLEPVLQFIINRLMRSDSADLTILDKLISIMTGVAQVENDAISDVQLQAYASGREMVKEAFNATLISIARPTDPSDATAKPKGAPLDKARSTKRSLPRLINALRFTELAMPIWIALGQTRQGAVDKMAGAPIKAIAAMQDTVHGTFVQFGELLAEYLSPNEHVTFTPDLASLVSEYGLDFSVAFLILRPRLNAELAQARSAREAAVRLKLAAAKEQGIRASISPSQENTPLPSPKSPSMDIDERDDTAVPNGTEGAVTVPAPKPQPNKAWYPSSLRKPMEQARDLLPHDVNEVMGAPFFVIFWHLTMGDIAYSAESYDKAIAKITSMDRDVSTWRTTAVSDQKSERVRLKARIEVLSKEKDAQAGAAESMKRRLARESKHWFGSFVLDKGLQRKLSHQLHQYCFYPRALLTAADAVYVARFIRLAHDLGTVGFSTLWAYYTFFSDALPGCIFSSTTNEARNFGRCLAAIMADLDLWHKDEKRYLREALGVDSANADIKALPGMEYRTRLDAPLAPMTWKSFREMYAKWHNTITKALLSCWAETDFMHIKNGITIAIQVLKSYPVMQTSGKEIESAVKDLIAGKTGTLTPDLQHQCQAYLRMLNQRKATRPYILPGSFHQNGIKLNPPKAEASANSAHTTPAPTNGDIKPNGTSTPAASTADPKVLRAKLEENKASRSASAATAAAAAAAAASSTSVKDEPNVNSEPEKSTASPAPSAPPAGPRASRSIPSLPPPPTGPSGTIRGHASTASTDRVPTGPASTRSTSNMGPPHTSTSLSVDEDRAAARARKFGTLTAPQPPSGPASAIKSDVPPSGVDTRKTQSPAPSPARRNGRSGSIESGTTERSARERDRREPRERRTSEDKRDSRELLPEKENGTGSRTSGDEPERGRLSRDTARRDERDKEKDKDDRSTSKPERESFSTRSRRREEETPRRIDDPRDRDREKDREHRHRRRDERDDRDLRDGRDSRDGRRRDEPPEERRDERDRRRRDRPTEPDREGDRRPSRDLPPHNDRASREPAARETRDTRDTRTRDRGSKPLDTTRPESTRARDLPPHELQDDRDRRDSRARPDDKSNGGRTPRHDEPPPTNGRSSVPPGPHGDRIIEAPRSTRSNDRDARLPARPDSSRPSRAESNNPPPSGSSRTTHALPARPGATSSERRSPPPAGRNGSSLASRMGPPATASAVAPAAAPVSAQTPAPTETEPADRAGQREDRDRGDRTNDLRKRPHEESTPPAREDSPGASKRVKIDRDKARSHDRRGREGKEGGGSKMLNSAVKSATE